MLLRATHAVAKTEFAENSANARRMRKYFMTGVRLLGLLWIWCGVMLERRALFEDAGGRIHIALRCLACAAVDDHLHRAQRGNTT